MFLNYIHCLERTRKEKVLSEQAIFKKSLNAYAKGVRVSLYLGQR